MKSIFIAFASAMLLFASCAPQKTCPTYLKNELKNNVELKKV
jgi:hypothetical protein